MNRIPWISEVGRVLQVLFIFFLVIVSACEKIDAEKEIRALNGPVAFIDQYQSLLSVAEIASKLRMSESEVRNLIQPNTVERKSQMLLKQEWFEVTKKDMLLGYSGKMRFELFHDRLGRIVFYPDDIDGFVARGPIAKAGANGVVPTSIPSLRIAIGANYIVWFDQRIMNIVQKLD